MQTIAINSNNDIYLDSSGNLALKSDLNAMGDILTNKAQTNKNELLYSDKGIDFFNTIFSSPSYPDLFQNELTNELLNTESVEKIEKYTDKQEKEIYSYTTEIQTEFGRVSLNG